MPKLLIWSPFRGNIGTIKAVQNYSKIFREIGYEVVFVELCDEWSEIETVRENYRVISLTDSNFFKNIGKSNRLWRRDFFIYQFFKVPRLRKTIEIENPDLVISFLGIAPAILGNFFHKAKHWGSIQGFPRFLNNKAHKNLYLKIEDFIRRVVWRVTYKKLDQIICMTPGTSEVVSKFLDLPCEFVPNPLFAGNEIKEIRFNVANPYDFIFVGRNSFQKRLDLTLAFFASLVELAPSSRLHFFGDVEEKDLKNAFPEYRTIIGQVCQFHGYQPDLWSFIEEKLNPVHVVSSQWEDPGHAILEGMVRAVPTIFINRCGDYIKLYERYGAITVDLDEHVDRLLKISMSAEPKLRERLKSELASQFHVNNSKSKLLGLLNV